METPKPLKGKKYLYAKGGRKTAVSQCRLYKNGKGSFLVNDKDYKDYFKTTLYTLRIAILILY